MRKFSQWIVVLALFVGSQTSLAAGKTILDRIVLHPSRQPETSLGQQLILPSGIEVWVHHRPQSVMSANPIYLIHFIGNASRAEKEVPEFLDLFPEDTYPIVWSVNYPGYGHSKGKATLASLPAAALDVYDNLAKISLGAPIWVSSFSIGTLPALYLSKERPVQALILRNPVPLKELIERNYGWASWVTSRIPAQLDSINNSENIHAPALFLSSERDEIVAPVLQQEIISHYGGKSELVVLPQAHHSDWIPKSVRSQIRAGLQTLLQAH